MTEERGNREDLDHKAYVAFIVATLGTGGIGRVTLNLTKQLVSEGYGVDLVIGNRSGPLFSEIDPRVNVVSIPTTHAVWAVPSLARYLRMRNPAAVITEKLRVNVAVHRARKMAGCRSKVLSCVHGLLSHKLDKEGMPVGKRNKNQKLIAKYLPRNDALIAVSKSIADDLVLNFAIANNKVHVIHNPIITEEFFRKAAVPCPHPWLEEKSVPVVLGAGRLSRQKDFPTLIKAFSELRKLMNTRLIILGDGPEKGHLEQLAKTFGLEDCIDLPGFVHDPQPYLAAASVFVLCSLWEGFGNVLVEAMAVGTPVVATDCPAGPREILEHGRLGPLVSVGDPKALAEAIFKVIENPLPGGVLRDAASKYSAKNCAAKYLKLIGDVLCCAEAGR